MARISPLHLPRPARQVLHREVADGDQTSDFWFRALDTTQQFAALSLAKEKTKIYITGDEKTPAYPFPAVGGEAVLGLTEDMMVSIAFVCTMQSDTTAEGAPVPEAPYTFEEWVAMSLTRPRMWSQVLDITAEVAKQNEAALKNAGGAVGTSTSGSPLST
jgi:hypothetical protein